MNTLKTTLAFTALVLASITVVPNQASACGVIGCFLNEVAPGLGDAADDLHDASGNPLDQAAPIIAEGVLPGSGVFVAGAQQMQRAFNNFQGGGAAPGGSWSQQKQSRPMGNVCLTQFGRSAPGPYQPIGTSCSTWDPYGRPVWGTVGF